MRTCLLLIPIMTFLFLQYHHAAVSSSYNASATTHLSPHMQKLALFQFKLSMAINPSASPSDSCIFPHPKTMNWSMNSDYCAWEGITCDRMTGDVIGLDLSCSQLVGAIPPNSTLFQLSLLQNITFYSNDIHGVLPEEIFHLPNLILLNLQYNPHLVIKGVEIQFVRILTVFTTIDLSGNKFEGEIPQYIGNLKSLRYLNLSHNHLSGQIPSLIGKLSMLESLDLSFNRLEGIIPQELTGMYFLSRLNVSKNDLTGHIPEGAQFNTFENDSYGGNLGLCGRPLSKKCIPEMKDEDEINEDEGDGYFFSGFTWEAVVIGYGSGVVVGFVVGYMMFMAGKPKWFTGIIARELGLKVRRMEIRHR